MHSISFLRTHNELGTRDLFELHPPKASNNSMKPPRKYLDTIQLANDINISPIHDVQVNTLRRGRSSAVQSLYSFQAISKFSGSQERPRTKNCDFPSGRELASAGRTMTSSPPGERIRSPRCWVSGVEMASKTYFIGFPANSFVFATNSASGSDLSTTKCAPRFLTSSALCGDAVVMIGENPASLEIWITERNVHKLPSCLDVIRNAPICPREPLPPRTTKGVPWYLPRPSPKGPSKPKPNGFGL